MAPEIGVAVLVATQVQGGPVSSSYRSTIDAACDGSRPNVCIAHARESVKPVAATTTPGWIRPKLGSTATGCTDRHEGVLGVGPVKRPCYPTC
jgi:hypothetical protein